MASFDNGQRQKQTQKQEEPILAEPSRCETNCDDNHNHNHNHKAMPPKDYVCPITTTVFADPVTLETGQTYERRAIQEWLERGNATCPITRQKLQNTQLPKTNYVLKRLIGTWQEEHSNSDKEQEQEEKETISITKPEFRQAVSNLCDSEDHRESESAVLCIEQFWRESSKEDREIIAMLSNPVAINAFVEILFNSAEQKVLSAAMFVLSELGSRDRTVIRTLRRVNLVTGLVELLIGMLKDMSFGLAKTKLCTIVLLRKILEEDETGSSARAVIKGKAVETVVDFLGSGLAEERNAAVGILIECLREDGKCRSVIAGIVDLGALLESFVDSGDPERFQIVRFLFELVKLNRRTLNEKMLYKIRDEGSLSTMHNLVVYLQTATEEKCPFVAGLLLQLDLLSEPRKMSIFREEAIDSLIACLRNADSLGVRVVAAETIMSLQGRFSLSGKPMARGLLLKRAGLDKSYDNLIRIDQLTNLSVEDDISIKEEEKAAENWERKMAFVLAGHEFGLLFEALSEGMESSCLDLRSACFVSAAWLVDMLRILPDTGVCGAARVCLLKHFVSVFKSSRNREDRALSLLALNSFVQDPEGVSQLKSSLNEIIRGVRELKKFTPLATQMLKVVFQSQDSSAELWTHKQLVEVDCSDNGEVLSVVCFKNKIFSGHSDGTIKVWTGKGSVLHPIVEIHEHSKAVTSLVMSMEKETLYSGSLDKTIRVWSVSGEGIDCIQVHDMKDQVQSLVVYGNICCFIPQGSGVKVQTLNGMPKLLNSSKTVKCLALAEGKLYCGCQDNSIQEINLATEKICAIQGSSKKLLAKANPIQALQTHGGQIYVASSLLDGASVKILSALDHSTVGSLPSMLELRAMALSQELVYLGCKKGTVEIWDREKHNKIDTLQTSANSKVLCLGLDSTEEVLVIGTSNGLIQAWGLS